MRLESAFGRTQANRPPTVLSIPIGTYMTHFAAGTRVWSQASVRRPGASAAPRPAPGAATDASSPRVTPTNGLAFAFFLLVNLILFVRPAEIAPELLGVPLYELAILSCLAASFPALLSLLLNGVPARQPIIGCVLGMLIAIVLSHLSHFNLYSARLAAVDFLKVLLYYLLFVCNVSTPARLRQFLAWLAGFALMLTILALLHFHGVVTIPALEASSKL